MHIVIEKQPAEFFAGAQDLASLGPSPAIVGSREIEQLEGPIECVLKSRGSPGLRVPDRAIDLAANVR